MSDNPKDLDGPWTRRCLVATGMPRVLEWRAGRLQGCRFIVPAWWLSRFGLDSGANSPQVFRGAVDSLKGGVNPGP